MIKEAIILAGGFGTRLAHIVNDVPKPMAPVAGLPFLTYILSNLQRAGIKHVILCTGYKSNIISDYYGNSFSNAEDTSSAKIENTNFTKLEEIRFSKLEDKEYTKVNCLFKAKDLTKTNYSLDTKRHIDIEYSIEDKSLRTSGAVKAA